MINTKELNVKNINKIEEINNTISIDKLHIESQEIAKAQKGIKRNLWTTKKDGIELLAWCKKPQFNPSFVNMVFIKNTNRSYPLPLKIFAKYRVHKIDNDETQSYIIFNQSKFFLKDFKKIIF